VAKFLEAAKGVRFERLFKLAFHVGCRPGELLALKWASLDAEAKTIRIDQSIVFRRAGDWYLKTTKTKLSRRTIALTDGMVDLLLEQKSWQDSEKIGKAWKDHGFIFTNGFGEPYSQSTLKDDFKKVLKLAGLPWGFNPYSARHTMATLLLAGGVDVKAVSERMGHSSPVMTLNVYAHVLPGRQAQISEKIEALLRLGNAGETNNHHSLIEEAPNQ
jgi:integrase